eukprot:6672181-Heterocapsa_arctica.AAC.1
MAKDRQLAEGRRRRPDRAQGAVPSRDTGRPKRPQTKASDTVKNVCVVMAVSPRRRKTISLQSGSAESVNT